MSEDLLTGWEGTDRVGEKAKNGKKDMMEKGAERCRGRNVSKEVECKEGRGRRVSDIIVVTQKKN